MPHGETRDGDGSVGAAVTSAMASPRILYGICGNNFVPKKCGISTADDDSGRRSSGSSRRLHPTADVRYRRSPMMKAECDDVLSDDDGAVVDGGGPAPFLSVTPSNDGGIDQRLSPSSSSTLSSSSSSKSRLRNATTGSVVSSRSSQIGGARISSADNGSFLSADASPTNYPVMLGAGAAAAAVDNGSCNGNGVGGCGIVEMPEFIVDSKTKVTYLKGNFLGKGGFARVHLVTDLTTNATYAGKIIAKSHIRKRHHMEKITREVELQSTLKHQNVVRFYHFFEDSLNVYIILENCDGMSLAHELKQRGRFDEDDCLCYMWQLVQGLQYVHGQNIIHRDLKLGNMFLTKDHVVKIGDFGLATRHCSSVAAKASICGTPNYIAPEVLQKQGHRFASDVWSLGCSMYAMLVGYPPFETESLKDTYTKILTNDFTIPYAVGHHARALIVHLLRPEHSDRPTLNEVRCSPFFVQNFARCRVSDLVASKAATVPVATYGPFVAGIVDGSKRESLVPGRSSVKPAAAAIDGARRAPSVVVDCRSGKASTLKTEKRSGASRAVVPLFGGKVPGGGNDCGGVVGSKAAKMSCNIRMRITKALCPDVSQTHKRRSVTSATLYNVLSTCMENMPDDATSNPPTVYKARVLFIVKWIDYSNRYGFGFELSDHSVGVYFNDSSRLNFSSDRSRLEFLDDNGNVMSMTPASVPAHLQEKYTLLCYFCQYMEDNLTEGGVTKGVVWSKRTGPIPYMKRWLQTSRAIIMQLGNGTLQINFFKDHTKVIVGVEKNEYLVTYINEERHAFSYRLVQIAKHGCDVGLRNRLLYTCNVLCEFATLENNAVAVA